MFALFSEPVLVFSAPSRVNQKKADYMSVKAQIDEVDAELSDAVEDYNYARYGLSQTNHQLKVTSEQLAQVENDLNHRKNWFATRLRSIYIRGKIDFLEVLVSSRSFEQFLNRFEMLTRIGEKEANIISEIKADKKEIETKKAFLVEQQKKKETLLKQTKAEKKRIEQKLRDRQILLASIQSELAQLEREEAERQARLRSMYAARLRKTSYVSRGAPQIKARGDVVAIALAQLGKPYRWAAEGPNAFDCSGLTMYCYAQVGINLPHSSAAQYSCGERVDRAHLQPGDLVFFSGRRGRINHVGMYIGDGNFIHAPRTGDVVKITSLASRSDYVGAVRP